MTTGEKIKLARKAAKMTQRELSEKTGIAEPTIRKYESDRLNPKYNTLVTFANALGVRMAYFLSEETLEEISNNPDTVEKIAQGLSMDALTVQDILNNPSGYNLPDLAVSVLTVCALLEEERTWTEIEYLIGLAFEQRAKPIAKNPGKQNDELTLEKVLGWYRRLNAQGQRVALERLQELAKIPEYQRKDDET